MSVWASRVRVDGHNGLQLKALQLDEGSRGPNVVRAPRFVCACGNDVEKSLGKSKRKAKKKRKNKSGGEMNQESQQMVPMGSKVSRVHSAAAHLSSVQLGNYIVYSSEKKINRLAKVNVSEEAGVGVSKPERSRRTKSAPVSGKQKQRSFRPSALKKSIRCERKRLWEEHNPSNSLPQLWDLFNMLEERQHLTCPQNHIGSFTALENLFVSLKFKRYLPVKIERKVSDEVILYRNPVLISSSDAGINEYITKHSHHLSDKIDQRIHSNRTPWILQGVSNILSDELDLLVTALLSKLQLLQKRLKEHDPFKVRARMRYVLGSRQVLKGMKAGRVKVLIVSPDIEPILPLQEMINTILSAAKSQNIPIVFALSLKMLRTVLALPAGAKPSCVGIYSTDGAHEEYRELMTHLPQSKQQFSELISLK